MSEVYNGYLDTLNTFIKDIPSLKKKREIIQASRKRIDKAIFFSFGDSIIDLYKAGSKDIADSLGISDLIKKQAEIDVLVISNEIVAKSMAGPGIRAYNISKELAKHFKVTR